MVFYEETQTGGASQHFDCTNFSLAQVDRAHTGLVLLLLCAVQG